MGVVQVRAWSHVWRTLLSPRYRHYLWRHRPVIVAACLLWIFYIFSTEDAFSAAERVSRRPVSVVVVSYKNAGSSVVGAILQRHPHSFYHAEPLRNLEMDSMEGQTIRFLHGGSRRLVPFDLNTSLTKELSHHLLNCHYERLDLGSLSVYYHSADSPAMRDTRDYFSCHGRQWYGEPYDSPNTRLAFINSVLTEEAKTRIQHCLPLLTDKCKAARVRIFDFMQMRMAAVIQMLEETDDVKVVYIVRDPRAIIEPTTVNEDRSAEKLQLFILKTKQLCVKFSEDLGIGAELKQMYPKRVLAIRYEDYIEDPVTMADALVKFLDKPIKMSSQDADGVDKIDIEYPVSDTIWRKRLDQSSLTLINDLCGDIYAQAGYVKYADINDIRNLSKPTYIGTR